MTTMATLSSDLKASLPLVLDELRKGEETPLDFSTKRLRLQSPNFSPDHLSLPPPMLSDADQVHHQPNIFDIQKLVQANQVFGKMQQFLAMRAAANLPQMSQSQTPPLTCALPPTPESCGSNSPSPHSELLKITKESMQKFQPYREEMLQKFALNKVKRKRKLSEPSLEDEKMASSMSDTSSTDGSKLGIKIEDSKMKDAAYRERRRRNNEAAKRSRDARRAKEDEIAIRAAYLEQENLNLKWEVARMKAEVARIRAMLLNDSGVGLDESDQKHE